MNRFNNKTWVAVGLATLLLLNGCSDKDSDTKSNKDNTIKVVKPTGENNTTGDINNTTPPIVVVENNTTSEETNSTNETNTTTPPIVVVDTTPPTFTSSNTFSVVENKTAVGSITTDDANATLTLGGTDAASFNFTNGVLSFKVAPDYESKTSYALSISATDTNSNSASQNINVYIVDIADVPFITVWETTSSDKNITIPTNSIYDYNYTIDWGDGEISSDLNESVDHTYTTDGNYTVKIFGLYPHFYLLKGEEAWDAKHSEWGNAEQLQKVLSWGDIKWKSFKSAFAGAVNLELNTTDVPNLEQVADMSWMFFYARSFNHVLNDWDVSNVTNMEYMFYYGTSFNQALNDWNVSNVTNMYRMFYNATSFSNQDLSAWDISSVKERAYFMQDAGSGNTEPNWISIFTSSDSVYVNENNTTAITLQAEDVNGDDLTSFSISGGDSGSFNVDNTTGVVTFKIAPDYETKKSYTFTATATDGVDPISQDVTIHIKDLTYKFTSNPIALMENNTISTINTIVTNFDPDTHNSALSYSIKNNDAQSFNIDTSAGTITNKSATDFDTKSIYNFTVVADDGMYQTEQNMTILVKSEAFTHNSVNYKAITSPYTGKVWLDRNLGATQVCTAFNDSACYGDFYQYGRNTDGHEESNSTVTAILATDVSTVGHGNFITNTSFPSDWTSVDSNGSIRSAQWSKTDGTSVCPVGYRVPTEEEIKSETITLPIAIQNRDDAIENFLKIPSSGNRSGYNGNINYQAYRVTLWSSNKSALIVEGSNAGIFYPDKTIGISLRCIKD